jgi:chorismate dehydratase
MPKRIGIPSLVYSRPVSDGLRKKAGRAFELVEGAPAQLAYELRQAALDGAFLSPIDYARDYSRLMLVPDVGAVSEGESGAILLVFHEKTRKIETVCADPAFASEVVLAHLVLVEKYGIAPQIVPFAGPWEEALGKADAVLAAGDEALSLARTPNKMDLVDEWKDITEFPYVHGVWAVRENALTERELRLIVEGTRLGEKQLPTGAEMGFFHHFRYRLDEPAVNGLTEFYRMAYYHGILKDIPEIRFVEFTPKN